MQNPNDSVAGNPFKTEFDRTLEPWMKAARIAGEETEKMQQAAVETLQRMLDESHRLAREGLTFASTVQSSLSQHLTAQMEKNKKYFQSLIP